jgi:adenylyltransferase/sulfurtransferase
VLGILPGLLGVIQATETIKLILGNGEPLIGRLLLVDALTMRFRELKLRKNPACVLCGPNPTVTKLIDYEAFCGVSSEEPRPEPGMPPADALVSSPAMFGRIPAVTVEDLKAMRDRGDRIVLVDVRESQEWAISDLPDSVKIPLGTLPQSLEKLSREDEIVVYCRSGARSGNAVQFLRQAGYEKAKNLVGGINKWAERIDPTLQKY